MRVILASLCAVLCTAALIPTAAAEGRDDTAAEELSPPLGPAGKQLIMVPEPDESFAAGGDPTISKILYVNRCVGGCQVYKGSINNALTNTSTIPAGNDGQLFTISEFQHDQATWDTLMQCLRDIFLPYDVMVTDVDPGMVPHHEAIAAGAPSEVNLPSSIGGIAPSGCEPRNNAISFSFLNTYPANQVLEMCATVGQESSHSYGLGDHLYDCTDPMTYLGNCGQKFFRNKLMPCGEFALRDCNCTGTRQNSHVKLLSVFGPSGATIPSPTVSIVYPAEGAAVANDLEVISEADDPRTVFRVELYLNDWLWDTYVEDDSITPPWSPPANYRLRPSGTWPDGNYEVKIVAYNDLGASSAATINVTKGSACTSADQCLAGQTCESGGCRWAAPTGQIGDACTYDQFCVGPNTYDGTCASDGNQSICTRECFTGVNDDCPDGTACLDTSGGAVTGVCWPAAADDPGCCSTSAPSRAGLLAQLTMVGLVVGFLLRRRRRA
ncbi:MAG: hypothetical protein KC464_26385, partial [Myxococcales bacterium]|nr:hypothetical protein [Myxococcales bacterium]